MRSDASMTTQPSAHWSLPLFGDAHSPPDWTTNQSNGSLLVQPSCSKCGRMLPRTKLLQVEASRMMALEPSADSSNILWIWHQNFLIPSISNLLRLAQCATSNTLCFSKPATLSAGLSTKGTLINEPA